MSTQEQQTKLDGGASVSTVGLGVDAELLAAYSRERGIGEGMEPITVARLIDSHRSLIRELEQPRQEWRDELQRARERVEAMTMDATWISIDKLRGMTVQELANLIGEE